MRHDRFDADDTGGKYGSHKISAKWQNAHQIDALIDSGVIGAEDEETYTESNYH